MKGNRWIQLANGHASIGWPSIKGGDNAASFGHYASIMIGRLSRPDPPRTIPSIAIRETVNSPRRLLYESLLSPSFTILLHCTVYTPIAYRSCAIIPDTIGGGSHAMHFSVRTTLFPFYIHTFKNKSASLDILRFFDSWYLQKKEKFYFDNSNFLIYKITR